MENNEDQKDKKKIQIPIAWYYPEDLITRYSTNLLVQAAENEIILSFFEIIPPILLGSPDDIEAQLEQTEAIKAKCVARIIVSGEKFPDFLKAMGSQLEKYQSSKEPGESE